MIDWDDAFDNSGYVEGSEQLAPHWAAAAAACRESWLERGRASLDLVYGAGERCRLDLFTPTNPAVGLILFVHGGYWHLLDKSYWSHLAAPALAAGWAMAIPSYPLAPEARIGEIRRALVDALEFAAARIDGPLRLAGHSAGGHLVTRLACGDSGLGAQTRARLQKVVAISGIYDLRPLLQTRMNETLGLDAAEAAAESPALLPPAPSAELRFWVGAGERPEFLRQTRLVSETWAAQRGGIRDVYEPGKHHFSVIDALGDGDSDLCRELLD